jgi:hypothetical protein
MVKREKSSENSISWLRLTAAAVLLCMAAFLAYITFTWFSEGTAGSYRLPNGLGRVTVVVPPQALGCAAEVAMDYGGGQRLLIAARISGLKHHKYGPVIGLILDFDAQPPDFPWPPFPKENSQISGETPSNPWAEIGVPFGPYFGHVWLFRLARTNQSYQFHASFPGSEVADRRPLSIAGKVSNSKGVDSLEVSMRPAGSFRIENGDRITYRPPMFANFSSYPELSDPARLLDVTSNTSKLTSKGVCPTKNIRATAIFDQESIDPNSEVDPAYKTDPVQPAPSRSGALFWQKSGVGELAPVASLVDRDAEDSQNRDLWLAGSGVAVILLLTPVGVGQLWKSVARKVLSEKEALKARTHPMTPQAVESQSGTTAPVKSEKTRRRTRKLQSAEKNGHAERPQATRKSRQNTRRLPGAERQRTVRTAPEPKLEKAQRPTGKAQGAARRRQVGTAATELKSGKPQGADKQRRTDTKTPRQTGKPQAKGKSRQSTGKPESAEKKRQAGETAPQSKKGKPDQGATNRR